MPSMSDGCPSSSSLALAVALVRFALKLATAININIFCCTTIHRMLGILV